MQFITAKIVYIIYGTLVLSLGASADEAKSVSDLQTPEVVRPKSSASDETMVLCKGPFVNSTETYKKINKYVDDKKLYKSNFTTLVGGGQNGDSIGLGSDSGETVVDGSAPESKRDQLIEDIVKFYSMFAVLEKSQSITRDTIRCRVYRPGYGN